MNSNHSFRTSITVLTVATIVGCGVMLLSGFSQFRLRPAASDKALISTANQKLRNRFGEFYPAENRVPATTTNATATNLIQNVSGNSTFDEVVTTTSEYDNSEVTTSWSSGTTAGVPQVSVPVTINVNNGELMAQLIETRESLAEVKAKQAASRQDQRVFSYQVHKSGSVATTNAGNSAAGQETSTVGASNADNESTEQTTRIASKTQTVSQHKDQAEEIQQEWSSETTHESSEMNSASREVVGRSTSRMRSIAGKNPVLQTTQSSSQALPSSTTSFATKSDRKTETESLKNSAQTTEENHEPKFEAIEESSSTAESPVRSIEEEISFEPIPQPVAPPAKEDAVSVPVIEPISYIVDETAEESRIVSNHEEMTVEFGAIDTATPAEVPASLPELSFDEPKAKEADELPVLSLEQNTTAVESDSSSVAAPPTNTNSAEEPTLPTFFGGENAASEPTMVPSAEAALSPKPGKVRRTREQLASAFAAVRGLPPEDLFRDHSTPFVTPVEPAEPANEQSTPSLVFEDSSENTTEATPPTISFGGSSGTGLAVLPSSAAAPVELEFGEPSSPNPSLAHSETPGAPETPVMPPTETKPERWYKYRSRIHLKQNSSPSTPVPPVPELASTPVPEVPVEEPQEPSLVPPAAEDSSDKSIVNSDVRNSEGDRTITDSPLMIPDEDGSTEVAQNTDSGKLGSLTLPPVPELAPIPELAPVPKLESLPDIPSTDNNNLVYEPQPVMDRLNEVTTEMNTPPGFSPSHPMISQRTMPHKSARKLPFETTFRRINKRVAWMADALSPPENKTAQQKPMKPKSSTIGRSQQSPHPPTHRNGQAVAKKHSNSTQLQLPKLTAPKFAVQTFALPNVNFQSIQAPAFRMPTFDTPDWLACPPDVMAPVRNSTAVHRVMSTMQFAGQPKALN